MLNLQPSPCITTLFFVFKTNGKQSLIERVNAKPSEDVRPIPLLISAALKAYWRLHARHDRLYRDLRRTGHTKKSTLSRVHPQSILSLCYAVQRKRSTASLSCPFLDFTASTFPSLLSFTSLTSTDLILTRRALTRLQLVKIPPADLHVPLILVHAAREVAGIGIALRGRVPLLLRLHGLRGLGGGCGRPAAEHAADGVADGGADRDATGLCQHSFL